MCHRCCTSRAAGCLNAAAAYGSPRTANPAACLQMSNERAPPAAAASFEALPHDVIELISSRILQDVSPLFDRHDVLLVACTVVPVGSPNTRLLSQLLFSFLSPRLGEGDDPNLGGLSMPVASPLHCVCPTASHADIHCPRTLPVLPTFVQAKRCQTA